MKSNLVLCRLRCKLITLIMMPCPGMNEFECRIQRRIEKRGQEISWSQLTQSTKTHFDVLIQEWFSCTCVHAVRQNFLKANSAEKWGNTLIWSRKKKKKKRTGRFKETCFWAQKECFNNKWEEALQWMIGKFSWCVCADSQDQDIHQELNSTKYTM